jgi:hypothetical protein
LEHFLDLDLDDGRGGIAVAVVLDEDGFGFFEAVVREEPVVLRSREEDEYYGQDNVPAWCLWYEPDTCQDDDAGQTLDRQG